MAPKGKAKPEPAPEPEPEPEHDEEDSDDEDEHSDSHSEAGSTGSAASSSGAAGQNKKKKKKKKKKSKGAASAGGEGGSPSSPSQPASAEGASTSVSKAEGEKRFAAALTSARSNDDMWIKLSGCNIYDAKTKKLMDALKNNTSVTSLDLSHNHISDEGAQAIAALLTSQCPELIELDMRDNSLSAAGLTCLEGLKKMRKQLVVHLVSGSESGEGEGSPGKGEKKDLSKGPMFRKYFQTGNDDEDDGGDEDVRVTDGGVAPEQLWEQIAADVAEGPSAIPELGTRLQQLIALLTRELGTLQVQGNDTVTDGSRPHIKGCIMNLDTLDKIFAIVPRNITMQYSKDAQKAVGSHRVWASEVVAMLVAPNITALDRLVASSKLVPRVLQAALSYGMCSALHIRALRVLRSCCVSKVAQLYGPLFTKGMGAGLTQPGSEELVPSVQQQLQDLATPALGVLPGVRPAVIGFVLEACKVLLQCSDEANRDTIYNASIARLLNMDASWSAFAAPGGLLERLCKEQEGDLGGPRAARMPMDDSADLAELAGGGLISGNEILALLQSMQVSGGLSSMLGS